MAKQLKVNDIVKVIAGDHKGESAKIIGIDRAAGRAILEGIGELERHLKKSYLNPTGGKKTVQTGIALSNLKLEQAYVFVNTKDKKKTGKKNDEVGKNDKKSKKGAK